MCLSSPCATVRKYCNIESIEEMFNRGGYYKRSVFILQGPRSVGKPLTFVIKNLLLSRRLVIDATELKGEIFTFVLRVGDLDKCGLG